jgi:hypothetical protein
VDSICIALQYVLVSTCITRCFRGANRTQNGKHTLVSERRQPLLSDADLAYDVCADAGRKAVLGDVEQARPEPKVRSC